MSTDPATPINTDEICSREAIQRSAAIQPHGFLLLVDGKGRIACVSENIGRLFSGDAGRLLGAEATDYVDQTLLDACRQGATEQAISAFIGTFNVGDQAELCDACAHRSGDLLFVELMPRSGGAPRRTPGSLAHPLISKLSLHSHETNFAGTVVQELRALTGWDRVMLYYFHHDGSGEVMAESLADDMEPWLGQRYPAADIPAQARALYVHSRIRLISDVDYQPVPLLGDARHDPATVDLSHALLRSVSPVHREYLRNMKVGASMSLSIVVSGALWGMVLFQHREPQQVSREVLTALDLTGMFLSMHFSAQVQAERRISDLAAADVRDGMMMAIRDRVQWQDALSQQLPLLVRTVPCDGVALLLGDTRVAVGLTPTEDTWDEMRDWLQTQPRALVHTRSATDWCPQVWDDSIAGLMALPVGESDWLLFLRRERTEEVLWAGVADKRIRYDAQGRPGIAPRTDFSQWKELMRGFSDSWDNQDIEAAARLHALLQDLHERSANP